MHRPQAWRVAVLSAVLVFGASFTCGADSLRLIVQNGYLSQVPVLVRVEILKPDGSKNRDVWEAQASLTVDQPGVLLSTNKVTLRNGLGSALVTFSGGGNFNLTARLGNLERSRFLTELGSAPVTTVSGTLNGISPTWSGVVRVTGDVTVANGSTLTIQAGTLVLLNGVASGTSAPDLIVNGAVQSLGSESQPVVITCADPGLRWGQIRHSNAQPSSYRYTTITMAGRATGEGHTGTGPVIRPTNSKITFESCSITDHADNSGQPGKIMYSPGSQSSEVAFDDCLLARSRMGPEVSATAILCTNTWIMEMFGPDDADGIYLHDQQPGQQLLLTGCVLAAGNDDAVDTLGSVVTLENCIIRDWSNPNEDAKGVSVFHGETTLRGCLIVNCFVGVSAKSSGPLSRVNIDRSTILGITRGVSAAFKDNAQAGNIDFRITNSIVRSVDAVHTDFGPTNLTIGYCNLGESWPGSGNFTADPLFTDSATNFRLLSGSPCIDAGDPAAASDPDGTRADAGAFPFPQGTLSVASDGVVINEIMYHPSSESVLEEYIELFNRGTNTANVSGWRFSAGVQFVFPTNTLIPGNGYLVIAADLATFAGKYPGVTNVLGNWTGILGNSREDIDLDDAFGERVDSVRYADEGDWAVRQRGPLDRNHRGWTWFKPHDGGGSSLELMNGYLSNNHGQNWTASATPNGTPGRANSVLAVNLPPLVLEAAHEPFVPRSTDTVLVTARIVDERPTNVAATLHYRVDSVASLPFTVLPMFDDGFHDDGSAKDGIFGATLPAQSNNTVIEFYLRAVDLEGNIRTWPGAAIGTDGTPLGQMANSLYQVDDSIYTSAQPLYKFVLREVERAELADIGSANNGEQNSDAQMSGTFIAVDGTGTTLRYLVGIRNRGHGTRNRKPNNHRVNFRSDDKWKGVAAINLNGQFSHLQLLGSTLCLKSGLVAANSRPVQLRVNNADLANDGPQTYGHVYAANEALHSDWAESHFPLDSSGNIYRAVRDIPPPDFVYRGEDKNSYANTWFKETNVSEDDWTDLIGMLRVVGTNDLFATRNVRQVVNVEQWMLHLAVMALFDNRETGLNSGFNDDYYMYRGADDSRFILVPHDLDSILGEGGSTGATNGPVLGATNAATFNRFMRWPDFEPVYYRTMQSLIDTTFSAEQFSALVDQTLGRHVPGNAVSRLKAWMDGRRAFVQSQIAPFVPPNTNAPIAVVFGEPRSPTPLRTASLTIGGAGVTHYRYKLNGGGYSPETPVSNPVQLSGLSDGSTNTVYVIGRNLAGVWQDQAQATVSKTWLVNTAMPAVRINEVLANNVVAVNHNGTFPDAIEFFNEGDAAVDLSGLRLSDNPNSPGKYVFENGTTLSTGAYLVVYANNNDGTPGIHVGFSLSQEGEGVYLFDRLDRGGALLDSVEFGLQLPDLSIARLIGGDLVLAQPTFGAANVRQALGDVRKLKINEWLVDELSLFPSDFVEIYNPESLPLSLGGLWLTDNPIGWPTRHRIAPLTFIGAGGYRAFSADSDPEQGADHLSFGLATEQGMVALLAPDQAVIDCVNYGPQRTDVSEGRSPNGALSLAFFLQPTPGAPNPSNTPEIVTTTNLLVTLTNLWRYDQSDDLTGVNWTATNYSDSSWPIGSALLYFDSDNLPGSKNTQLSLGRTTYYFRARFNFNGSVAGTTLWLSPFVDDGAVFYLNGGEVYRIGMPTNSVITYTNLANRNINNAVLEGVYPISSTRLVQGENVFAVEVHQFSSTSQDIVFGTIIEAITVVTNSAPVPIVLNEVLADNNSMTNANGLTLDWVELFNPSGASFDLSDMSLSDEFDTPRKWIFPQGTSISANGYLVIYCDGQAVPSTNNTGFGLNADGGAVYLFHRPSGGSAVLDAVTFGVQAADYSIGRIGGALGGWTLNSPTPGGSNTPATLGNVAALRINEWMADPFEGADWFELYNPGVQPVELSGLALTDDLTDHDKSPISALSFIGTGSTAFRKFVADGSPGNGADHADFNLGDGGDNIGLFTAAAVQIDAVTFGLQSPGGSQGRFPDGASGIVSFAETSSPGEGNYLPLTSVVINELLSHTDPPLEDAVELYNPTATDVNIGGWYLSHSADDLRRYRVPPGTVVPARAFKVLYELQFGTNATPEAIRPFNFNSAQGDQVYLSQTNNGGGLTGYRAGAAFGASANGVSFGRHTNSVGQKHFVAISGRSFGMDHPTSLAQFRSGTGAANLAPLVGPVVINEFMYSPVPVGTNSGAFDEFIELRNITANLVPFYDPSAETNGWRLRGGIEFNFPPFTTLAAGAHLVIVAFDPASSPAALADFRNRYGVSASVQVLGPYQGQLSNSRESVELLKPDPPQLPPAPDAGFVPYVLVERIDYSSSTPWPTNAAGNGVSLQRQNASSYGNDPLNWFGAAPTAGQSNENNSTDRDGDGLPNDWETQFQLDPDNPNGDFGSAGNPDGDGLTNLQEYIAGTSPVDPLSHLKIESIARNAGGIIIRFTAVAGKTYSILFHDDVAPGVWFKLTDVPAQGVTGVATVSDPDPGGTVARFYRLVTPQVP